MAKDKLTVSACDAVKPGDKPYKLSDGGGMYLEIMPNGSKYWRLKYRLHGKEKRYALGVYPDTSLKQARKQRDEIKDQVKHGIDPVQAKHEARRQAMLNAENTFESVAREWHENRKTQWSQSHADNVLHRLETDIFPQIGERAIADISSRELLDAIRKIEARGAHELAKRTLRICGQVFRYAIAVDKAENDPSNKLHEALRPVKQTHFASLSADELPELVRKIEYNEGRLYAPTQRALKIMLYTFVRTGELIKAKWSEIDFERAVWIIPGERMKMGKEHLVPLSRQAVALFEAQYADTGAGEWIFPNKAKKQGHMSNNTILNALYRMGYKGQMTGHGFRALAMSTIKESLGYRHEVIDRQLAHVPGNKIDRAYDRAQFWNEREKMMQHWADYIDSLASDSKVVAVNFG